MCRSLGRRWATAETPIKQRQISLFVALMLPPGATTDQLPSTVDGFGPIRYLQSSALQLGGTLRFHGQLILPLDECARIGTDYQLLRR